MEPSTIEGGEDRAVFQIAWRHKHGLDFDPTEDHRELLRPVRIRDMLDHPRTTEGGLIEETQGTDRLDEQAPRDLFLD